MKIAVTYDNGNIFQHFGKTENFKIYEVEGQNVVSSEVIGSNGTGHGALAGLLAEQGVNVLIGEEHDCGQHEEEHSCGGSCGSCAGCGSQPPITGRNAGKICKTHYRGTFNDGTQFDSSYDRGEPLEFICGAGQMIRGFDAAVANMEVGEIVDIHLMPDEAYGMPDPNAIFMIEMAQLPGSEDLEPGERVYLSNQYGQPIPVTVVEKDETSITFDANHEMAGKELNFRIELVEVK